MFKFDFSNTRKPGTKKALVLMYHRIANLARDPWELAVNAEHFEQHLALLKEKFTVITVAQLVSQLTNRNITADSVCLTFDDGYADNFHTAKQLLEKYACPATFFITSQNLLNQQPFWWDELEALIFDAQHLPGIFSRQIGQYNLTASLGGESALSQTLAKRQNSWVWPGRPPTERAKLYLRLWQLLKQLPHQQIQNELAKIKAWAEVTEVFSPHPLPMTVEQLQTMSSHELFEVGIHTVSHPALSSHTAEIQLSEIIENRSFLENHCHRSIDTFAFPYGDYNTTTLDLVQKLKIAAAFSTTEISITNTSNPTNLGRFQVKNWNKDQLEQRLKYWFKNA